MSTHHDEFGGLHRDLLSTGVAIGRRRMLRLAAGMGASLGVIPFVGCASGATGPDGDDACARIPEETAGPFPAEGSNGPNVLTLDGVVRRDIRSSFGGLTGTADGVPLTLELTVVSAATCSTLEGAAIYVWHCDRPARYSLYSPGVTSQNYLRGVQAAGADGKVVFQTIFPGCYAGRWPHVHFEVFRTIAAARDASNQVATSQIALPRAACDPVYATAGYESSRASLANVSLASDVVFRDGAALELATVTGRVGTGLTAALTLAVPV